MLDSSGRLLSVSSSTSGLRSRFQHDCGARHELPASAPTDAVRPGMVRPQLLPMVFGTQQGRFCVSLVRIGGNLLAAISKHAQNLEYFDFLGTRFTQGEPIVASPVFAKETQLPLILRFVFSAGH